jgi:hypothetical protein
MMLDQTLDSPAPDRGEVASRFGWLSAEEIDGAFGAEPEGHADATPKSSMLPPAFPTWPRVYPGL